MSKEKKKSIYDSIKEKLNKPSSGGGKIFFTQDGDKKKIRFLRDLEEAIMFKFHASKYGVEAGDRFCHPCLSYYGKPCPRCKDKAAVNDEYYALDIYDYKAQEVKLFIYKVNKCTPMQKLIGLCDEYGTIVDRDYSILQTGEQTAKLFDMLPSDKKRFKIEAEGLTEEDMLKLIKEDKYMFNLGEGVDEEDDEDDEEEEEEKPKKKKKNKEEEVKAKKKKPPVVIEDDDDDDDDDEEEEEEAPPPKKRKK